MVKSLISAEDIERNLIDFLKCEKPREEFGSEIVLGSLAAGLEVYFKLVDEEPELAKELEVDAIVLGYNTIEEYRRAFENAVNHYKPTLNGKPFILKKSDLVYANNEGERK